MFASPAIRELERVNLTSPLGVRLWDPVSERMISDGLLVTAAATDVPSLPRIGLPNRQNGFVFRSLPGLRDSEFGAGDSPFWASPPIQREFLIRVTDTQDRFLPLAFRAIAPHPGWFTLPGDEHPENRPSDSIPLFPSPAQIAGSAAAAVRADLWDITHDRPAAWAVLEVRAITPTGTTTARGLANADGRVLVAFGYPESTPPAPSFSPPSGVRGLAAQTWTLEINVYYAGLSSGTLPPDLSEILTQPAAVALDRSAPDTQLHFAELRFGHDLVLRSSGDALGRVLIRAT